MSTTRFALAQIDTCVGDLDGNAAKVMATTRMARERADVVVFPEMTLTGYPIEDLALRATFREAAWNKANELAAQLESEGMGGLYVVVGTVGTDHANGKPRNRLVVLHGGLVWAGYDKHFLPNYGVFDEFRIFSAGERHAVLSIDGVRVGLAICEDIWQDGGPVAELAAEHIDVLLTINGSPYEEGKTQTRLDLARRRAAEVHAPMIYVNQVGGQDDLVFDGGTFVVDTDGTLLQRSPMFMEDLAYFTLDTDREHQEVCEVAPRMDPDEEVYTACVLGLKDYMAKNGFTGVCLGLSGGIGGRRGGRRQCVRHLDAEHVFVARLERRRRRSGRQHRGALRRAADQTDVRCVPAAARAGRRVRGEPAGAHPRRHCHGLLELQGCACTRDREQVRARLRLFDNLR